MARPLSSAELGSVESGWEVWPPGPAIPDLSFSCMGKVYKPRGLLRKGGAKQPLQDCFNPLAAYDIQQHQGRAAWPFRTALQLGNMIDRQVQIPRENSLA